MTYRDFALRLLESYQVIHALSVFGIVLCVALIMLWMRYEEITLFIKDDGLQHKFAAWKQVRQRAKALKRGACPEHGGNLKIYRGKCPVKGCTTGKENDVLD